MKKPGAQYSPQTGRKSDKLMGEGEVDNILPGDMTAGQNTTEEIRRKSYTDVAIERVRRRARVFLGDSIVKETDRTLGKGDDVVVCFPCANKLGYNREGGKIVGPGKEESVFVHVVVRKYRQLVRRDK